MAFDAQVFIKAMKPRVASKAMQTFDRATTVVVGVCWASAVLMMAFALYTTMLSVSAKRAAQAALVAEPSLPKIVRQSIDARNAEVMVERLHRLYPNISITLDNNQSITVTSIDGSKFREWLTALSYIDTISPEYHWSMTSFCVGKCPGNDLMRAVLAGERISFEKPQAEVK